MGLEDYLYFSTDLGKLYCGDCLEILPLLEDGSVDLVLTDPPYPNNAGLFIDAINAAKEMMMSFRYKKWLVFWDELSRPPVPLPLVAVHIWHRNNTNRPDNYEAIYQFCADGRKRASRVLSYPVISVGLTGCIEATGHPSQKNIKLIKRLLKMNICRCVLDPFLGSGTTAVACEQLQRRWIGIEISPEYCELAKNRLMKWKGQQRLTEDWF